MSTTEYRLSWDSFKSNVCDGFTNLQQNEEFVDMTLAADGHLVKVHKNIFALASPYIKSMLQSTPNEHPIIFLSNISHDILNYILTYVYTGEVSVEVDNIQAFMRVAKELRLSGLFGMPIPKVGSQKCMKIINNEQIYVDNTAPDPEDYTVEKISNNTIFINNVNASQPVFTNIEQLDTTVSANLINITNVENVSTQKHTSSNNINIQRESDTIVDEEMVHNRENGLYMTADGYQYKLEIQPFHKQLDALPMKLEDAPKNTSEMVSSNINNDDNFGSFEDEYRNKISNTSQLVESLQSKVTLQYTVSNRGSLQLILNRFMYYCHHHSHGGRKRRWRCIEYRSNNCPAFIDTDGEIMISRKFEHCHSFHDEKIRKKMKREMVYTNLNLLLEKQNKKTEGKCDKLTFL